MSENEETRPVKHQAGQEIDSMRSGHQVSARYRLPPTVTLDRAEYELLKLDAGAWRLLNESPHVTELLAEWVEWAYRRDLSESTAAMAGLCDWRKEASVPTYAQLERRRNHCDRPPQTPAQIKAAAEYSWRRFEREHQRGNAA